MNSIRKLSCIAMVALAAYPTVIAQIDSDAVDRLMNNGLRTFSVAGASVVIVKDGKIVHSKGYGVRSVDTKAPVKKDAPFAIG